MYKIALSILHNEFDAEDAVHQTFVTLADHLEKIKNIPCHKLDAYIVIITRNVSINFYNKNRRHSEHITSFDDDRLSADVNFFEQYDYDRLVKTISELPKIYKDVLFLHCLEELSFKQISQMLNISVNCVRKRFERAKKLLKKTLEKGD